MVLLENKVNFEYLCTLKDNLDNAYYAMRRAAKKEVAAKRDSKKLDFKPATKCLGSKQKNSYSCYCPIEFGSKKVNDYKLAKDAHEKALMEHYRCKTIFDRHLVIYAGVPEDYNNDCSTDMGKRSKPDVFFGPLDKKGKHIGHYAVDFDDGIVDHIQKVKTPI